VRRNDVEGQKSDAHQRVVLGTTEADVKRSLSAMLSVARGDSVPIFAAPRPSERMPER